MNLQDFKNNLSAATFGMSVEEGISKGICINCKEEALPKCHSDAGRREFKISGLCEVCWDEIVGEG